MPEAVYDVRSDGAASWLEHRRTALSSSSERAAQLCVDCGKGEMQAIKRRHVGRWGGGRGHDDPSLEYTIEADEIMQCSSCGEMVYTHEQSMTHHRLVMKAVAKDWRRLAAKERAAIPEARGGATAEIVGLWESPRAGVIPGLPRKGDATNAVTLSVVEWLLGMADEAERQRNFALVKMSPGDARHLSRWLDFLVELSLRSTPPQSGEGGAGPSVEWCRMVFAGIDPESGDAVRTDALASFASVVLNTFATTPPAPSVPATPNDVAGELSRITNYLIENQTQLPDDARRILSENLWDLYDTPAPPARSGGAAPEAKSIPYVGSDADFADGCITAERLDEIVDVEGGERCSPAEVHALADFARSVLATTPSPSPSGPATTESQ